MARAMGYNEARQEALFLTDKMAYELGLNQAQYDAVYEINFDYFMAVSTQKNIKGTYLNRRNYDINFVLTPMQYSKFYKADYFYTPAIWNNGIAVKIYSRYPNRRKMFYPVPRSYRHYRGEHSNKYNNVSWYKGKDFKSSHAIRSNGPERTYGPANGIGNGARPNNNHGHGTRSWRNNNNQGHGIGAKPNNGIGSGADIGSDANTNSNGIGHGVGTGARTNNGVGSGAGIGSGANTNSTGIGHGVGTRSH